MILFENTLLTLVFCWVMTTVSVLAALLSIKLIMTDMKNVDEDIISDGKTGAEMYDKMIDMLVKGECDGWTPAFYDIDNDFVELNGEKILYNEEDQE